MQIRPRTLFALGVLLTPHLDLPAAEVTAKSHAIFNHAKEEAERSNLLMHEARVGLQWKNLSGGIEISNRLNVDKPNESTQPLVLEKKNLTLDWSYWKFQLGDSHQELGKGIALSLYQNPVFGIDNTLEGGSADLGIDNFRMSFFGGRINDLDSPVALYPQTTSLKNNEMWLAGISTGNTFESFDTSLHYLFAANRPLTSHRFDRSWHTVGTTFQKNWTEEFETYLESNVLLNEPLSGGARLPTGLGSYGAFLYSPPNWKWKLEAKDYRRYAFEFRRPPTLEEDIIESINISDTSAARLHSEHRTTDSLSLFGSYLIGEDRLVQSPVHHPVVGIKLKSVLDSDIEWRVGYRTLPDRNNLIHTGIKTKWPTFKGQSLEVGYRKQYANVNLNFSPSVEDKNAFDLTYSFSRQFNLSFGYEYLPRNDPSIGQHFLNGGAQLNYSSLIAKTLIGTTNGGTLCSGGVCRQVPPYSGGMLETVYSF